MGPLRRKSVVLLTIVCGMAIGWSCTFCGKLAADSSPPAAHQSARPSSSPSSFGYPLPLNYQHAAAIACMKRLPDGAVVCVNQKTVVGVSNGAIYIEEADRSAGIKIDMNDHYPPIDLGPGHLVTFTGTMRTTDGERIIYAESGFDCDLSCQAEIGSLGMSSAAIMGWPIDPDEPDGPRVSGLMPIGLVVRVWGQVIAKGLSDDEGMWYIYLDDGWRKKDGTDPVYTGLRVYSDRIPPAGQDYQVAIGVCTTKTYDPTPLGPSGDEFVIPVVRSTRYEDLYYPDTPPAQRQFGRIWGQVSLTGQGAPGVDVRVYSQYESVIVEDVTSTPKPFTLDRVADDGAKITASAAGYKSGTRDAAGGDDSVDFVLEASQSWMEVSCDKQSLRTCSDETAAVTPMVRDCEGKRLPNRQVKLTTSMGSFVPAQSPQVIVTTDSTGFVSVLLTAAPDGAGVAAIRAEAYPDPQFWAQTEVTLTGPEISVTAGSPYLSQPGSSTISAHLAEGGQPMVDALVTFHTDHGVFQESGTITCAVNTDGSGDAQAVLLVDTPGTARVLARYINECSHGSVGWVVVALKAAPWYTAGARFSHPAVIEMDGDLAAKEVVVVTSSGDLTVLDSQGSVLWHQAMLSDGSNTPAFSVMDSDRSGLPCVFIGAENQQKLYAFTHDGKTLAGWPAGANYRFIRVAPTLADVNLDGSPEVIAGDECCYVFSWNPTGDWKCSGTAESSFLWRNLTGSATTTIYGSTCAAGDLDDDPYGILDVAVGTNHAPELYVFQGDLWGDFVSNPRYLTGWPKSTGGRIASSPAIGDIDGDGKNDLAVGCDSGNLWIWLSSDDSWTGCPTGGAIESSPALCDLDGDDKLDVIVGSDSGRLFAFNWLGQAVAGWAGGIMLNAAGAYPVESSPVVGDVTGDGKVEVVVGCHDGNLYAVYADGFNHQDNGMPAGPIAWVRCCVPLAEDFAQILTAPVIDDLDNDGKVEVVAGSDKGVYVFQLDVPYVQDPNLYPWPTFHRDNQRTGCATTPPAPVNASIQGIVKQAGQEVAGAQVYIYLNDGSPVYVPHSDPPLERDCVLTVCDTDPDTAGKGAYCISQLEPNRTYKLKVVPDPQDPGTCYWVTDIAVTTGLVRVDVVL